MDELLGIAVNFLILAVVAACFGLVIGSFFGIMFYTARLFI